MIEVKEALAIILGQMADFGTEEVPLYESLNRILREDWILDRDLPPYDRVTMDGIAINFQQFENGKREFHVEGVSAAGSPQMTLSNPENCLEVMTGVSLPVNTDTVIRYEDVEIKDGVARVMIDDIVKQQNIHFKGIDKKEGSVIVPEYTKIGTPEIGIGASIGKLRVKVARFPKVMIISTGDELVEIDQTPEPYQIRRSNVYRLKTTLLNLGIHTDTSHLEDDKDTLEKYLSEYLEKYEVLILSGGVSAGKFDFLPEIFNKLGVKKHFHKIRQRPGKPFWFGVYHDKCHVFAFPGNPVSSFVCLNRYFLPWLERSLGVPEGQQPKAILKDDVPFKPDLTYFLEVKLEYDNEGRIWADPKMGNGSGDFTNLVNADAFIELPRGKDLYKKGEVYPIFLYR